LETRCLGRCNSNHTRFVPPSGGSLEIGNIKSLQAFVRFANVPPSGGSLEIGNLSEAGGQCIEYKVPPSGGSLEIGNSLVFNGKCNSVIVPPSGGSLEIGNSIKGEYHLVLKELDGSPFGGIPRNWKLQYGLT